MAAVGKTIITPTGTVPVGPYTYKAVAIVTDNPRRPIIYETHLTSDLEYLTEVLDGLHERINKQPWRIVY